MLIHRAQAVLVRSADKTDTRSRSPGHFWYEITPGQASDYTSFNLIMADNRPKPSVLLADRGYDADSSRKSMKERDVLPAIPMRKYRKMRVGVDRPLYRLQNLAERCFDKLKNSCRVANRYDTRPPKALSSS